MTTFRHCRYVGAAILSAAMFSACGGSQPSIGAPGAMARNLPVDADAERGGSWMLPEAKSGALLYVDSDINGQRPLMSVFTYPRGKLVGTFDAGGAVGLCSDAQGDVYAPSPATQQVLEYAHGSMSPFNSVSVPGFPYDCSIDPTSGNLAVLYDTTSNFGLAIYNDATGAPTLYQIVGSYCGYDGNGNLFVDDTGNNPRFLLYELPKGSNALRNIAVGQFVNNAGQVQWDGTYITVQDQFEPGSIYRLSISGSSATLVGTTKFKHITRFDSQSWIWAGKVAIPVRKPHSKLQEIGVWEYPAGGAAIHAIASGSGKDFRVYGLTVSVAPH